MSLTYPILNDIIISKLDIIKQSLLDLKKTTIEQKCDTTSNIDKLEEKINTQNVKTELIHSLFKHMQSNSNKSIAQKDFDDSKLNTANLLHAVKTDQEKLSYEIQRKLDETNKIINKSIDIKLHKIQNYINNIEISNQKHDCITTNELLSTKESFQINIDKIYTTLTQINIRLDGLEDKYVKLQNLMQSRYQCDINQYKYANNKGGRFDVLQNNTDTDSDNYTDSNGEDNGHNWVKVTKKH